MSLLLYCIIPGPCSISCTLAPLCFYFKHPAAAVFSGLPIGCCRLLCCCECTSLWAQPLSNGWCPKDNGEDQPPLCQTPSRIRPNSSVEFCFISHLCLASFSSQSYFLWPYSFFSRENNLIHCFHINYHLRVCFWRTNPIDCMEYVKITFENP